MKKYEVNQSKLAVCTEPFWEMLLDEKEKDSVIKKIKDECLLIYGHTFNECLNRKICWSKSCIGRELPIKSDTFKSKVLPLIKELYTVKNGEVIIDTSCTNCKVRNSCKSTCSLIHNYLNRDYVKEPELIYKEQISDKSISLEAYQDSYAPKLFTGDNIAWDCLTGRKKQIVQDYFYKGKNLEQLTLEHKLYTHINTKIELYSALTRLSKFSSMRVAINKHQSTIASNKYNILYQLYFSNKTEQEVANSNGMKQYEINRVVSKFIKDNGIKWKVFVYRNEKREWVFNTELILK